MVVVIGARVRDDLFFPQGHLSMSGAIFGVIIGKGGCYWHLVGRDQGYAEHVTMHRAALHNKKSSVPEMPVVPRLRYPWCRERHGIKFQLCHLAVCPVPQFPHLYHLGNTVANLKGLFIRVNKCVKGL